MGDFRDQLENQKQSLLRFYDAFFQEIKITKLAPLSVSVGTTSVVILPANTQRKYAVLVNDSDVAMYIAVGTISVINKGDRVNAAGGVWEMNYSNLMTGTISAITTGANKILCGSEGT